jgi:hypothetical protein
VQQQELDPEEQPQEMAWMLRRRLMPLGACLLRDAWTEPGATVRLHQPISQQIVATTQHGAQA